MHILISYFLRARVRRNKYNRAVDDPEKSPLKNLYANTDFKPFFITGIVGIVLWNIYCYYMQFESRVGSLIQKAKAPIEKELKVMS